MANISALSGRILVTLLMIGVSLGVLASASAAQTPQTSAATAQAEASQGSPTTNSEDNSSPTSFVDSILRETGNHLGFSFGLFRVYTSDRITIGNANQGRISTFTSAQPRIFSQFEGRRSTLRLDYALAYKFYGRGPTLDNVEHSASVQFQRTGRSSTLQMSYSYGSRSFTNRPGLDGAQHSASLWFNHTLSRSVSLRISDTARRVAYSGGFRSTFDVDGFSLNDRGFSVDTGSLQSNFLTDFNSPNQDIYLTNERETANTATLAVGYRFNQKGGLTGSVSHDYQMYASKALGSSQGVQVGIGANYQVNRWLSFDSTYTTYLNTVNEQHRTASIQRLQLAGLRFRAFGGLELATSAGMEHSRYFGLNQTVASFEGSVAKTKGSVGLSATYHHGLSRVNGPGVLLNGDNASATASIWVSRRVNLGASSSYLRGSSASNVAFLETFSGSGSVGIALQQHLQLSAQYSYVSQKSRAIAATGGRLERYAVSAGLQYFLPSLYGRR